VSATCSTGVTCTWTAALRRGKDGWPRMALPNKTGWQTFKHADGSKVDIGPGGRVVRGAAPKYGSDGSRINAGQRLASDGSEIPRPLPHELHPAETLSNP
jgi:hypothetical protein